jgi:hypothetical protein
MSAFHAEDSVILGKMGPAFIPRQAVGQNNRLFGEWNLDKFIAVAGVDVLCDIQSDPYFVQGSPKRK